MRRRTISLSLVALVVVAIWIRVSYPTSTGPYSGRSDGSTNVNLGPFVNTVDPAVEAANHCISDNWTRSCYQTDAEVEQAISARLAPYSSPGCPNPVAVKGEVNSQEFEIRIVDRASLVPIASIWPNFRPQSLVSGSCSLIIYGVEDPSNPTLLAVTEPHSEVDLSKWTVPIGVFQK
jgi:hypothetical protein